MIDEGFLYLIDEGFLYFIDEWSLYFLDEWFLYFIDEGFLYFVKMVVLTPVEFSRSNVNNLSTLHTNNKRFFSHGNK
jgi:hypothetical protein